jgi:hypothetical protein
VKKSILRKFPQKSTTKQFLRRARPKCTLRKKNQLNFTKELIGRPRPKLTCRKISHRILKKQFLGRPLPTHNFEKFLQTQEAHVSKCRSGTFEKPPLRRVYIIISSICFLHGLPIALEEHTNH